MSELTEESVWLIVRGRGSRGIDLGDKSLQSLDRSLEVGTSVIGNVNITFFLLFYRGQ